MQSIARDLAKTKDEYMLLMVVFSGMSAVDASNMAQVEYIAIQVLDEYRQYPI